MFHTHQYKEIARTFSGTANFPGHSQGFSTEDIERIVFGITTILWECEKCQQLRKEELLGKIV